LWRISPSLRLLRRPLWVKSRHSAVSAQCPLYPQKRTSELSREMSALCQKQTFAEPRSEGSARLRDKHDNAVIGHGGKLLSTARSNNCDARTSPGGSRPPQSLAGTAGLIRAFSPERCGATVWEEDYDNPQNSLDRHRATCGWDLAGNGTERSGHRRLPTCGRRRRGQPGCTPTKRSGAYYSASFHNPTSEKVVHGDKSHP
jgi:hypothetical protein